MNMKGGPIRRIATVPLERNPNQQWAYPSQEPHWFVSRQAGKTRLPITRDLPACGGGQFLHGLISRIDPDRTTIAQFTASRANAKDDCEVTHRLPLAIAADGGIPPRESLAIGLRVRVPFREVWTAEVQNMVLLSRTK